MKTFVALCFLPFLTSASTAVASVYTTSESGTTAESRAPAGGTDANPGDRPSPAPEPAPVDVERCVDDKLTCARLGATKWLLQQQEADWSWNKGTSTSFVVMAMQLANESWYHEKTLKTQLGIKQLEIELLAELARSAKLRPNSCSNRSQRLAHLATISASRLAFYILALECTCHDTRDFYGNDLTEILEYNMRGFPKKGFSNHFQYALGVLALCQSGEGAIKLKHIKHLLDGQREDGCYRFDGDGPDVASLSLMALSCAKHSVPENFRPHFEHKFNKTISCIRGKQQADGSIGNGISTALASQALKAANVHPSLWQAEQALQRVLETQHIDGHFGNLGATVQILPLLANRHHGSVNDVRMACKLAAAEPVNAPSSGTSDSPMEQPGPPITIQVVLENSIDTKQEPFTVSVMAPMGLTLFQFLEQAMANSGGAFRFDSKLTQFGNFVTSFNGVANDEIKHRYWSILIGPTRESAVTGPDGIIPEDGADYIFYYKAY